MSNITITVNGEERQVPDGSTLADVFEGDDQPAQTFATALNGDFVARGARATTVLTDGDAVFTFQAITGG
ncbi:MAG TPA: sulfur carrier protein ThiS [Polaromonas sp.]|uniref:sulfur carrier protein ThiS n=1 Tax=Polaromonas sp. TaxID=1869339 RepID=UPI002D66F157|nr:sulfur carrier protein ThiS [Polaromonas sp.]HYW56380.1 sulfur carrier protein ThiS [Polaromonas sp.]